MKAIVKDVKRNITFGCFDLRTMSQERLLDIIGEKYRVEEHVERDGCPTEDGYLVTETPYRLVIPENDICVTSYPEWGYEVEAILDRSYSIMKWVDEEADGDEDIARVLLTISGVPHKYLDSCTLEYLGRSLEGTRYSEEDENIFRSERGYYCVGWK